jgi:uncharacterized protein YjbJ (UPF0337 family)
MYPACAPQQGWSPVFRTLCGILVPSTEPDHRRPVSIILQKSISCETDGLPIMPQFQPERSNCLSVESPSTQEEMAMDWNRIEGNWKQFKGAAKEKWGKLTDDDLNVIEGRREQLEGKLQQRYGFAKDQIHKDVDDWFRTLK